MIYTHEAVEALATCKWSLRGNPQNESEWIAMWYPLDSTARTITWSAVSAKKTDLEDAEPMQVLRMERNARLAETDFYALSDVTMSDAMETYRQDLRDLPASSSPTLNDKGVLGNVTWPTKP